MRIANVTVNKENVALREYDQGDPMGVPFRTSMS